MELLTQEIEKRLPALYSQEEVEDPICVLKYFTPDAQWSWFIVEGEKREDGNWLFFGKVVSPMVPEGELGYVTLSELENVRGPLGLPIERDIYWKDTPLSKCK